MPQPYRPVLKLAGLKHPRVQEFLNVRRHPACRGHPEAVPLEGTWMIRRALVAGVRLQAVLVCPALLQAEGLALAGETVALGAEGYEVSEKVLSRLTDRDGPDGIAALGRVGKRTLDDIRVGPCTRVVIADGWDLPEGKHGSRAGHASSRRRQAHSEAVAAGAPVSHHRRRSRRRPLLPGC